MTKLKRKALAAFERKRDLNAELLEGVRDMAAGRVSGKSTKKADALDRGTMRPEYRREDLGVGVRGKYYERYMSGTNLVLLSPDVAKAFPTAEAVNNALRSLIGRKGKARRAPGRATGRRAKA
jgi:hypothetical protein